MSAQLDPDFQHESAFLKTFGVELKKAARVALNSKRFTLIEARINPAEYRQQM